MTHNTDTQLEQQKQDMEQQRNRNLDSTKDMGTFLQQLQHQHRQKNVSPFFSVTSLLTFFSVTPKVQRIKKGVILSLLATSLLLSCGSQPVFAEQATNTTTTDLLQHKTTQDTRTALISKFTPILLKIPQQESITGQVVSVHDADTLKIQAKDQTIYTIRLQGIDAPELTQRVGQEAAHFLQQLLLHTQEHTPQQLVIYPQQQKGRYRRIIGEVFLPDGQNVNLLLLKEGYAWWAYQYPGTPQEDATYGQAELQAKLNHKGLWRTRNLSPPPVPPWIYRKIRSLAK